MKRVADGVGDRLHQACMAASSCSAQSQARVPRGLPTPANSHLFEPRLTKSREFSGGPTRGNSRIEGTRPVRSGLPPPPSRLPNLDREETRAGIRTVSGGFAGVGGTRDARDVPSAPHCRSRSRFSIFGGSVYADGFLVSVPFTLQWPPMAVWALMTWRTRTSPRRLRNSPGPAPHPQPQVRLSPA